MTTGTYVGGMRRQVGWFVMLGLGAVVALLLVATLRTDLFARKFTLYVSPPSASSFFAGQEVKFQGFTIGRVDDIELQPRGEVRVAMRLLDRYRGMLHQGSAVRLIKPVLLGQDTLEVTAGDVHSAMLTDGEQLPFQEQASLDQLLMDMKPAVANADVLLGQLVKLARWLNDPSSDVRQATANIRLATQGMDQGAVQQALGRVSDAAASFTKLSGQLADNHAGEHLASSLRDTARVMKNLAPISDALRRQAPETLARSRQLVQRLDALSRSLNGIALDMQALTPELPGLARQSRDAMLQMSRLAGAMRNSWLVGGGGAQMLPAKDEVVAPPAMSAAP